MMPVAEVVCAGCRVAYSPAAWAELRVVSRLTQSQLQAYLVGWENRVVEVRSCARCGRAMARATHAA
jgi:hypothetical protein